jgi:hypothetical protein
MNPKLDSALQALRNAGHKVGSSLLKDSQTAGGYHMLIDDVPRSFEDILRMAEEEERTRERGRSSGDPPL